MSEVGYMAHRQKMLHNPALEWYITFLTKQWCKAFKRGMVSLKKGPEATASLSLPNIHPVACRGLVMPGATA